MRQKCFSFLKAASIKRSEVRQNEHEMYSQCLQLQLCLQSILKFCRAVTVKHCPSLHFLDLFECTTSKLRKLLSVNALHTLMHSKYQAFITEVCILEHYLYVDTFQEYDMTRKIIFLEPC